ncbi:UNVERIFIED_CONTAM: hypothetical protein PYX00_000371 [Menopon gallinae]|uniref:Cilia- and flagella-associated protein 52 n=1 Tax=Menopon gallinae TaxID=328185 RepID=A0AAW2I9H8_9NEOP
MEEEGVQDLEIMSIIGFDGNVPNGLHCHPDGIHFIYPIGNSVTIQNIKTKQQEFLNGHTNMITAVSVSNSGKYIASGQINHMGFKSIVILWDFERRCLINKYEIHKVRVECVIFTYDDTFLVTLGGRDDTCIVIYDIAADEPLCGSLANGSSTGNATVLCATSRRSNCFISAGDRTLRYWTIDKKKRKTCPNEVPFNKIKRQVICMVMDENDEILYCGTTTGDVAKVYFGYPDNVEIGEPRRPPALIGCFGKYIGKNGRTANGNTAACYSQGVTAIILLRKGEFLIGAGDGVVEHVKERDESHLCDDLNLRVKNPTLPMLVPLHSQRVVSGVSSLKIWGESLIVGTVSCEIFTIDMKTWDLTLKSTCHTSAIYGICFPSDFSAVFATCSKDTIRVWNTETSQEMLRIGVPNFTCSGVCFYHDGKGIVSSWNDGTIRAFTPQTGKLMYIIHNAHNKGVSAINITKDGKRIVSGGGEGQVRVWDIKPNVQNLRAILQEHKGPVSALHINHSDDEAASASTDGSCIIWDIVRCTRKNIILSNNLFMSVRYHPSDCQILTTGTNRKISYWEAYDGSLIREIEGSTAAGLNTIDVSPNGDVMVSGGNDQMVKLWTYQEGLPTHVGLGHAGIITCARFSPDSRFIVTVSADGGIYRWKNPYMKSENPVKEADDIVSVIAEPGEKKQASAKDLEECITKTMKVKCKCENPACTCQKYKVTTMKKSSSYNLTVAKPLPEKPSQSHGSLKAGAAGATKPEVVKSSGDCSPGKGKKN